MTWHDLIWYDVSRYTYIYIFYIYICIGDYDYYSKMGPKELDCSWIIALMPFDVGCLHHWSGSESFQCGKTCSPKPRFMSVWHCMSAWFCILYHAISHFNPPRQKMVPSPAPAIDSGPCTLQSLPHGAVGFSDPLAHLKDGKWLRYPPLPMLSGFKREGLKGCFKEIAAKNGRKQRTNCHCILWPTTWISDSWAFWCSPAIVSKSVFQKATWCRVHSIYFEGLHFGPKKNTKPSICWLSAVPHARFVFCMFLATSVLEPHCHWTILTSILTLPNSLG